MVAAVSEHFVPCKLNSSEHAARMRQFGLRWLPGQVILSPRHERLHHSWIGFLPPDHYRAELMFGRAMGVYENRDLAGGLALWVQLASELPAMERSVEALYWAGVAAYREADAKGDAHPLRAAGVHWRRLVESYPQSTWARKVEIFLTEHAVA